MSLSKKLVLGELFETMKFCHKNKISLFVYGKPGIGKSAIIAKFAKYLAEQVNSETLFEDFRLSLESPESIGGVYVPTEDHTGSLLMKRAIPDRWVPFFQQEAQGVILFDEMNSACPTAQTIVYQPLHDRVFAGQKISDGTLLIAAGNTHDSNGMVYQMLAPVANRVMIVEIESTGEAALKDWCEDYAYGAGVHAAIIGYLHEKPHNLNAHDANSDSDAFPSQRSWAERTSKILHALDAGEISEKLAWTWMAGAIGESYAEDLKLYYKIGHELPAIRDIMNGKSPKWPDSQINKGAYMYSLIGCVTNFKQNYVGNTIDNEGLVKGINNALEYFNEKFVKDFGDAKDNVISVVSGLHSFVVAQGKNHQHRNGLQHMLTKQGSFASAMIEYQTVVAKAKG